MRVGLHPPAARHVETAERKLDAALVCTGGYLELERRAPGAVEVMAVPVFRGQTTYRSYVIVPASSRDRNLRQLEGKRFAFTDELSLSGHTFVAHLLREMGFDEQSFFATIAFTRSHDRSIDAIAKGLFDGAAVDSLVFDQLAEASPEVRTAVRVIYRSPEFGVSPVVASTRLARERRDALRAALLGLQGQPGAQAALRAAGIERFAAAPPGLYDEAKRVFTSDR